MAVELKPLPATFVHTRDALHRVAEGLVAEARKPHNEIALRQTRGGFGTPEFEFRGGPIQVRVEGVDLVLLRGANEERVELRSLAAGGSLLGSELLPDGVPDDETPLELDTDAAARLAELYEFAAAALDSVKAELPADARPSATNLWPEHFDIAFEAGDEAAGLRATYGVSPGDEEHPEPYVYVSAWTAGVSGELWNATGFGVRSWTIRSSFGPATRRPPQSTSCARGTTRSLSPRHHGSIGRAGIVRACASAYSPEAAIVRD